MVSQQLNGQDGNTKSTARTDARVTAEGALHVLLESGLKGRVDEGATYTYIGRAKPGTATSAGSWQVKRVTNSTGDVDWADGNTEFDNVWDNRASLSYS